MKKAPIFQPQSSFTHIKSPVLFSSYEKPPQLILLRKQHIAKQSTIDSTNSLIHFTLSDYHKLLLYLKSSFLDDFSLISTRSPSSLTKFSNQLKYKIHTILSIFPYFNIFNKSIKSSINQPKTLMDRYQQMLKSLEDIINFMDTLTPLLMSQPIDISTEKDCLHYFLQIFPHEFFNYLNPLTFTPKIFSSIWRYYKNQCSQDSLYEQLKLFLYGISIPSFNPEEYPLHKAIFEGNLPFIRRFCSKETNQDFYCSLEDQDPLGLSPLMYAIKINRIDAVLVLTECGSNPKLRGNPLFRTPIEEAISQRSHIMLKNLLTAGHRLKQLQWEQEKDNLIKAIEAIPDFSCEMCWECDSKFIPFAKKLAPSDTYKISKLGGCLRVDMTLAGFSRMKCVRGNLSALFKGKGLQNEGKFLIIDHEKKKIIDLLSDFDKEHLDNIVDEMIRNEHMNSEFKAENVDFNHAVNWKGEIMREKISGIDTMKFSAKGGLNIQLNKKDYLEGINFKEFKEFDEYFNYAVENSLLKEFQLNSTKLSYILSFFFIY